MLLDRDTACCVNRSGRAPVVRQSTDIVSVSPPGSADSPLTLWTGRAPRTSGRPYHERLDIAQRFATPPAPTPSRSSRFDSLLCGCPGVADGHGSDGIIKLYLCILPIIRDSGGIGQASSGIDLYIAAVVSLILQPLRTPSRRVFPDRPRPNCETPCAHAFGLLLRPRHHWPRRQLPRE
jgi:hypothetical protein